MHISAKEIAGRFDGTVDGDQKVEVSFPSKIEDGIKGSVSFLANDKYEKHIYSTKSSIVLVNKNFNPSKKIKVTLIKVDNPYHVFSEILRFFEKAKTKNKIGHEQPCFIHKDASVGKGCYIGAFAYIGENAKIGDNVKIYPNTYVGDDVKIGDDSIIYAGVKIYSEAVLGSRCIIHSGVVIGSDGFGFVPTSNGKYDKIPQTGNVIIGDDVEIGANTAIDRATMGSTIIGDGVKLDNLIQLAHNVEIDQNTVIAAQTGISGSAKIKKQCVIAGQVGIVGHITIADGTKIGAQSGISKTVKEPLTALSGSPAIGHKENLKSQVVYRKLPELMSKIDQIEKQMKDLSN